MVDPTPPDYHLTYLRERWERDRTSRVFLQLAEEYRRRGLFSEALEVLSVGLRHHPGYLAAQVALGRCRLEAGQAGAAAEVLAAVLAQDPTQAVASRLLIETWLQLRDAERARGAIERCQLLGVAPQELQDYQHRLNELVGQQASPGPGGEELEREGKGLPPSQQPGGEEPPLPPARPGGVARAASETVAPRLAPEPAAATHSARPPASRIEQAAPRSPQPLVAAPPPTSSRPHPALPAAQLGAVGEVIPLPPLSLPPLALPLLPARAGLGVRVPGGAPFDLPPVPRGKPVNGVVFALDPPAVAAAAVEAAATASPGSPPEIAPPAGGPEPTEAPPALAGPLPATPRPAPEPSPAGAAATPPSPASRPERVAPSRSSQEQPPVEEQPAPAAPPGDGKAWWRATASELPRPEGGRSPSPPPEAPAEGRPAPVREAAAAPVPAPPAAASRPAAQPGAGSGSVAAAEGGVEVQPSGRLPAPELRPSDPGTATLGELYLRQGHLGEAEKIFREVLSRDPENETALSGLEAVGRRRSAALTAADLITGDVPEVRGLTSRKILLLQRYLRTVRPGGDG